MATLGSGAWSLALFAILLVTAATAQVAKGVAVVIHWSTRLEADTASQTRHWVRISLATARLHQE
ncbi:MAG: hypothetical protein WAL56_10220 [Candidatus Sulfotelmatobacter sp.]